MLVGDPTGDYKKRSMGLEKNTQEERVSLADQFSREQHSVGRNRARRKQDPEGDQLHIFGGGFQIRKSHLRGG